jgi:hypothetical protein
LLTSILVSRFQWFHRDIIQKHIYVSDVKSNLKDIFNTAQRQKKCMAPSMEQFDLHRSTFKIQRKVWLRPLIWESLVGSKSGVRNRFDPQGVVVSSFNRFAANPSSTALPIGTEQVKGQWAGVSSADQSCFFQEFWQLTVRPWLVRLNPDARTMPPYQKCLPPIRDPS